MGRLEVTAAAVVLPTVDGREQYLYKGVIVESDAFTEKGIEHARAQGLIDDAPEIVEDEVDVITQADVDAAALAVEAEAQKVVDAKAELERERTALEADKAAFEAAKAEAAKSQTAPAPKSGSAKQS
jgi:hypothetical protein